MATPWMKNEVATALGTLQAEKYALESKMRGAAQPRYGDTDRSAKDRVAYYRAQLNQINNVLSRTFF
jgi:hypothetical protein